MQACKEKNPSSGNGIWKPNIFLPPNTMLFPMVSRLLSGKGCFIIRFSTSTRFLTASLFSQGHARLVDSVDVEGAEFPDCPKMLAVGLLLMLAPFQWRTSPFWKKPVVQYDSRKMVLGIICYQCDCYTRTATSLNAIELNCYNL